MIYVVVVQGKLPEKDGGDVYDYKYEIQAGSLEEASILAKLSFKIDSQFSDICFNKITSISEVHSFLIHQN